MTNKEYCEYLDQFRAHLDNGGSYSQNIIIDIIEECKERIGQKYCVKCNDKDMKFYIKMSKKLLKLIKEAK